MDVIVSKIFPDVLTIQMDSHVDDRGSFTRCFCETSLRALGLAFTPKQISNSCNTKKETLRGLHYQKHPREEEKIVSCIHGSIFDVIVDIRPNSPTYGRWEGFFLTSEKNTLLFIPKGFAHGFQTMSDNTIVNYMISEDYAPNHSSGIFWADKHLQIEWPKVEGRRVISTRDAQLPHFRTLKFQD